MAHQCHKFELQLFCLLIMKTIVKVFLITFIAVVLSQCKKDDEPNFTIPDNNFLKALIEIGIDKNGDSIITPSEAKGIKSLCVEGKNISDLTGIELFVDLDTLCCGINQIFDLDVSKNT